MEKIVGTFVAAIGLLKNLLGFLLIVRLLLSYLNYDSTSPIIGILNSLTDPIINLSRKILAELKLDRGMFDFSYILSLFMVEAVYYILIRIIW